MKIKKTLYEVIKKLGDKYEEVPAFLYFDNGMEKQISYPQFLDDVDRLRRGFSQIRQKRLGLWADNSYEWICNAAAMLLAGKEVILLDVNLGDEELLNLANYTDVEVLITDEDIYDSTKELQRKIPMILMGKLEDTIENAAEDKEGSIICFTSGTSRSSKGVVISADTLAECIDEGVVKFPGRNGERIYLPLPFHHIYGFTHIFHILKRGGSICIGHNRYLRKELEYYQPQTAMLVPSMLQHILQKGLIPESLYAVATGGGIQRLALAEMAEEQGIELYNLYGLSETLGEISAGTKEKGYEWQKPQEGVRFVVKEDGELGIYLPCHMTEYYKKSEDTHAVLDEQTHLLWTGDAAEIDEEGFVKICGRMRDTIVLESGEKIHAEDTDAELNLLEGVQEAAVLGIDGSLVAVFVPRTESSEAEILKGLKELNRKKASYARINKIWIYEKPFPRTATGKLKRFQLEKEYCSYIKAKGNQ